MGGVYDEENASRYVAMGARFLLTGSDHSYIVSGATSGRRSSTDCRARQPEPNLMQRRRRVSRWRGMATFQSLIDGFKAADRKPSSSAAVPVIPPAALARRYRRRSSHSIMSFQRAGSARCMRSATACPTRAMSRSGRWVFCPWETSTAAGDSPTGMSGCRIWRKISVWRR